MVLKWMPMINFSTLRERYEEFYTENGQNVTQLDQFSQQVGRRVDEFWSNGYLFTQDGQIINDLGGRPILLSSVNSSSRRLLGYLRSKLRLEFHQPFYLQKLDGTVPD